METTLTIILMILGAIVAILLLGLLAAGLLSWIDAIFTRYHERGEQAQWERARRSLQEKSYWFSEDEATMKLIAELANGGDTGRIRDNWRRNRSISNDQSDRIPGHKEDSQ